MLLFSIICRASYGDKVVQGQLYPQTCTLDTNHKNSSPWQKLGFIFVVDRDSQRLLMNYSMVAAHWNKDFFAKQGHSTPQMTPLYLKFAEDEAVSPEARAVGEIINLGDLLNSKVALKHANLRFFSGSHQLELEIDIDGEKMSSTWDCKNNNPYSSLVVSE